MPKEEGKVTERRVAFRIEAQNLNESFVLVSNSLGFLVHHKRIGDGRGVRMKQSRENFLLT